MFVGGMSVQADDARAKVIHCETLDNEQKAKMLLLINTKPDTTLPVFTGVPDFLLGHTLSVHLEGMTAGNNSYCTRNCIIPRHFIDPQMSMTTHCIWSHLYSSADFLGTERQAVFLCTQPADLGGLPMMSCTAS